MGTNDRYTTPGTYVIQNTDKMLNEGRLSGTKHFTTKVKLLLKPLQRYAKRLLSNICNRLLCCAY